MKDGKLLDEVHRAAEFSIIPAGNGYQFTWKDGHFMVPWEWKLRLTSADRRSDSRGVPLTIPATPRYAATDETVTIRTLEASLLRDLRGTK